MSGMCGRKCEQCNYQLHCQGCSYCEMPLCKEDCHRCFSLCPKRGGAFNYMRAVGGGEVKLLSNEFYELPDHIPIIPDRLTEELEVNEVVGIHAANFFSKNGEKINKRFNDGINKAMFFPEETKHVLEFYVKDRTLEGFWDARHMLYDEIAALKFHVVIAPNFSVYEDAPRMDHLYNMKRSSVVYNELREKGIPAVPDISWYNKIDLDQWIREIKSNNLKTIAFSFQVVSVTQKASYQWKHYLLGFKYLMNRLSDDVQVLVAGIVSVERLKEVKKAAGNKKIVILNQSAYVQSRRGMLSEGRKTASSNLSKNQVFIENLKYFNREYKKLNEGDKYAKTT